MNCLHYCNWQLWIGNLLVLHNFDLGVTWPYNRVPKWWRHKTFFNDFLNFVIIFRKHFQKYNLWWKFDKNRAKICWDMSSWTNRNLHTFSVILLSVRTGTQMRENVWQYLYIQRVISRLSFAQFTSHFHHNSYFHEYFLAVVMKFQNSKKMFFLWCHTLVVYSYLLYLWWFHSTS